METRTSILEQLEFVNSKKVEKDSLEYKPPVYRSNNTLLKICGVFSILFSLSTLFQIHNQETLWVTIILGIFLLLLLIINEHYKVRSLKNIGQKYFKSKSYNTNILIAAFTILVSLSSAYGLYTGIEQISDMQKINSKENINNSIKSKKIDSLSYILLYKLDSVVANKNTLVQNNIEVLEKKLKTLTRYQREEKRDINDLILLERNKLEKDKQNIELYIKNEIFKLEESNNNLSAVQTKKSDRATVVKIALCILALLVELLIIGVALNSGYSRASYDAEKESYDTNYNKKIEKARKDLENKPQVKTLKEYLKILDLIEESNSTETTKKDIIDITSLINQKYSLTDVDKFRNLMLNLNVFHKTSNNKVILSMSKEDYTEILNSYFSKTI